jgi:hypothetical protein
MKLTRMNCVTKVVLLKVYVFIKLSIFEHYVTHHFTVRLTVTPDMLSRPPPRFKDPTRTAQLTLFSVTEHMNALCGHKVEIFNVNLVVYKTSALRG